MSTCMVVCVRAWLLILAASCRHLRNFSKDVNLCQWSPSLLTDIRNSEHGVHTGAANQTARGQSRTDRRRHGSPQDGSTRRRARAGRCRDNAATTNGKNLMDSHRRLDRIRVLYAGFQKKNMASFIKLQCYPF